MTPEDLRALFNRLQVWQRKGQRAGAFTLSRRGYGSLVMVSEAVVGTTGFNESLGRFHKRPIREPIRDTYRPEERFLAWNVREVFQSPWRE